MDYLLLILGFATLIIGGELLVKGAVGLAIKANISKLVIGMTVVSFGTSAPELLVSLGAALSDGPDKMMSVGNVIGSNIANIALVLGVTALVFPITVKNVSIKQDWPVLMTSSILLVIFMSFFDQDEYVVNRWEGLILFILIIAFTYYLIKKSRQSLNKNNLEKTNEIESQSEENKSVWQNVSFLLLGCLGLVFGADWLLNAAVNIAKAFNVPSFIIGVTVLAFGTSVPELVTSVIAAYRKQTDIAIGNLIGSNIFNVLCVVGVTGSVAGMPLPREVLDFDIWWMLSITLILFPLMIFGKKIHRWKGGLLIAIYFSYMFFLISNT